jgi:mannose-6-phosphate isomerase-like protein (cupin superfamily)
MQRYARAVAIVFVLMAGIALNGRLAPAASAQAASPTASDAGGPAGLEHEILAAGLAEALPAAPAIILMERVTIAPGADIPASPDDPTFSFFRIESGTLTMTTDTPLRVTRAAALAEALATPGTMPAAEEIAADAEFALAAGDSVVIPPGVGGGLRNTGAEPVVVLVAQLFPAA